MITLIFLIVFVFPIFISIAYPYHFIGKIISIIYAALMNGFIFFISLIFVADNHDRRVPFYIGISGIIFFSIWIKITIKIIKNKKPTSQNLDIKKESASLNDHLKKIDIGGKKWTHFTFQNGKIIKIQSTNLAKICYKTIEGYKKNSFKENELMGDYQYFKSNYKTSFDEETYNKVLTILEKFVKEGGTFNVL